MAIYHLHVKNISRGDNRSAVAAAAYRAGETLANEAEERLSMFGGRRDVLHAEIRAPASAPAWCFERGMLWNAVEAAEKRKDARLAKEIEFSIPRELPKTAWLGVAQAMANAYTALGHVVDFAIHDDGSGLNPHVHMMLTTRVLVGERFGEKMREADNLAFVNNARALWEKIANDALGEAGLEVEIDARSHAARGLGTTPTQHRGANPEERKARRAAAKARGMPTMNPETLAAHRALLADKEALDRYPLLRERADWPPTHPAPSPSLTAAELWEHEAFWREVQRRQVEPEQAPDTIAPAPSPATDRIPQRPTTLDVPHIAARQEGALRPFDASKRAAADFAALELALTKASAAAGHAPRDPRSAAEWEEVLRASNEFKATLAELRAENERNRAFAEAFREKYPYEPDPDDYPVQAPDGSLIAPSQRDHAELEMIAEVERPALEIPQTARPERQPAAERRGVTEEVTQANHAPAPDPDMAWLHAVPAQDREPQEPQLAPELEWLHKEWAKVLERGREQEQERERER